MTTPNHPHPSSAEAGWYADPAGVWTWRWFDGSDWTATVNDGQTTHADEASLTARNEPAATAAPAAAGPEAMPPPQAPVAAASSTGRTVTRIIGWGAGAVVTVFALLVVIGLVFGGDPEPVASVEGAEVFASLPGTTDRTDANWFVVVEPGTSVAELEGITRSLLALPEAQGLRLSGQFLDSSDELEGYVELNRALIGEIDVGRLSDSAGEVDIDVIVRNTVGFFDWSDSTESHIVCSAEALTCTADIAVATVPRGDASR